MSDSRTTPCRVVLRRLRPEECNGFTTSGVLKDECNRVTANGQLEEKCSGVATNEALGEDISGLSANGDLKEECNRVTTNGVLEEKCSGVATNEALGEDISGEKANAVLEEECSQILEEVCNKVTTNRYLEEECIEVLKEVCNRVTTNGEECSEVLENVCNRITTNGVLEEKCSVVTTNETLGEDVSGVTTNEVSEEECSEAFEEVCNSVTTSEVLEDKCSGLVANEALGEDISEVTSNGVLEKDCSEVLEEVCNRITTNGVLEEKCSVVTTNEALEVEYINVTSNPVLEEEFTGESISKISKERKSRRKRKSEAHHMIKRNTKNELQNTVLSQPTGGQSVGEMNQGECSGLMTVEGTKERRNRKNNSEIQSTVKSTKKKLLSKKVVRQPADGQRFGKASVPESHKNDKIPLNNLLPDNEVKFPLHYKSKRYRKKYQDDSPYTPNFNWKKTIGNVSRSLERRNATRSNRRPSVNDRIGPDEIVLNDDTDDHMEKLPTANDKCASLIQNFGLSDVPDSQSRNIPRSSFHEQTASAVSLNKRAVVSIRKLNSDVDHLFPVVIYFDEIPTIKDNHNSRETCDKESPVISHTFDDSFRKALVAVDGSLVEKYCVNDRANDNIKPAINGIEASRGSKKENMQSIVLGSLTKEIGESNRSLSEARKVKKKPNRSLSKTRKVKKKSNRPLPKTRKVKKKPNRSLSKTRIVKKKPTGPNCRKCSFKTIVLKKITSFDRDVLLYHANVDKSLIPKCYQHCMNRAFKNDKGRKNFILKRKIKYPLKYQNKQNELFHKKKVKNFLKKVSQARKRIRSKKDAPKLVTFENSETFVTNHDYGGKSLKGVESKVEILRDSSIPLNTSTNNLNSDKRMEKLKGTSNNRNISESIFDPDNSSEKLQEEISSTSDIPLDYVPLDKNSQAEEKSSDIITLAKRKLSTETERPAKRRHFRNELKNLVLAKNSGFNNRADNSKQPYFTRSNKLKCKTESVPRRKKKKALDLVKILEHSCPVSVQKEKENAPKETSPTIIKKTYKNCLSLRPKRFIKNLNFRNHSQPESLEHSNGNLNVPREQMPQMPVLTKAIGFANETDNPAHSKKNEHTSEKQFNMPILTSTRYPNCKLNVELRSKSVESEIEKNARTKTSVESIEKTHKPLKRLVKNISKSGKASVSNMSLRCRRERVTQRVSGKYIHNTPNTKLSKNTKHTKYVKSNEKDVAKIQKSPRHSFRNREENRKTTMIKNVDNVASQSLEHPKRNSDKHNVMSKIYTLINNRTRINSKNQPKSSALKTRKVIKRKNYAKPRAKGGKSNSRNKKFLSIFPYKTLKECIKILQIEMHMRQFKSDSNIEQTSEIEELCNPDKPPDADYRTKHKPKIKTKDDIDIGHMMQGYDDSIANKAPAKRLVKSKSCENVSVFNQCENESSNFTRKTRNSQFRRKNLSLLTKSSNHLRDNLNIFIEYPNIMKKVKRPTDKTTSNDQADKMDKHATSPNVHSEKGEHVPDDTGSLYSLLTVGPSSTHKTSQHKNSPDVQSKKGEHVPDKTGSSHSLLTVGPSSTHQTSQHTNSPDVQSEKGEHVPDKTGSSYSLLTVGPSSSHQTSQHTNSPDVQSEKGEHVPDKTGSLYSLLTVEPSSAHQKSQHTNSPDVQSEKGEHVPDKTGSLYSLLTVEPSSAHQKSQNTNSPDVQSEKGEHVPDKTGSLYSLLTVEPSSAHQKSQHTNSPDVQSEKGEHVPDKTGSLYSLLTVEPSSTHQKSQHTNSPDVQSEKGEHVPDNTDTSDKTESLDSPVTVGPSSAHQSPNKVFTKSSNQENVELDDVQSKKHYKSLKLVSLVSKSNEESSSNSKTVGITPSKNVQSEKSKTVTERKLPSHFSSEQTIKHLKKILKVNKNSFSDSTEVDFGTDGKSLAILSKDEPTDNTTAVEEGEVNAEHNVNSLQLIPNENIIQELPENLNSNKNEDSFQTSSVDSKISEPLVEDRNLNTTSNIQTEKTKNCEILKEAENLSNEMEGPLNLVVLKDNIDSFKRPLKMPNLENEILSSKKIKNVETEIQLSDTQDNSTATFDDKFNESSNTADCLAVVDTDVLKDRKKGTIEPLHLNKNVEDVGCCGNSQDTSNEAKTSDTLDSTKVTLENCSDASVPNALNQKDNDLGSGDTFRNSTLNLGFEENNLGDKLNNRPPPNSLKMTFTKKNMVWSQKCPVISPSDNKECGENTLIKKKQGSRNIGSSATSTHQKPKKAFTYSYEIENRIKNNWDAMKISKFNRKREKSYLKTVRTETSNLRDFDKGLSISENSSKVDEFRQIGGSVCTVPTNVTSSKDYHDMINNTATKITEPNTQSNTEGTISQHPGNSVFHYTLENKEQDQNIDKIPKNSAIGNKTNSMLLTYRVPLVPTSVVANYTPDKNNKSVNLSSVFYQNKFIKPSIDHAQKCDAQLKIPIKPAALLIPSPMSGVVIPNQNECTKSLDKPETNDTESINSGQSFSMPIIETDITKTQPESPNSSESNYSFQKEKAALEILQSLPGVHSPMTENGTEQDEVPQNNPDASIDEQLTESSNGSSLEILKEFMRKYPNKNSSSDYPRPKKAKRSAETVSFTLNSLLGSGGVTKIVDKSPISNHSEVNTFNSGLNNYVKCQATNIELWEVTSLVDEIVNRVSFVSVTATENNTVNVPDRRAIEIVPVQFLDNINSDKSRMNKKFMNRRYKNQCVKFGGVKTIKCSMDDHLQCIHMNDQPTQRKIWKNNYRSFSRNINLRKELKRSSIKKRNKANSFDILGYGNSKNCRSFSSNNVFSTYRGASKGFDIIPAAQKDSSTNQVVSKNFNVIHGVNSSVKTIHDASNDCSTRQDVTKSIDAVHDACNGVNTIYDACKDVTTNHDKSKKNDAVHGTVNGDTPIHDMSKNNDAIRDVNICDAYKIMDTNDDVGNFVSTSHDIPKDVGTIHVFKSKKNLSYDHHDGIRDIPVNSINFKIIKKSISFYRLKSCRISKIHNRLTVKKNPTVENVGNKNQISTISNDRQDRNEDIPVNGLGSLKRKKPSIRLFRRISKIHNKVIEKTFPVEKSANKDPVNPQMKPAVKLKKYWQRIFHTNTNNDIPTKERDDSISPELLTHTVEKCPSAVQLTLEPHIYGLLHNLKLIDPSQIQEVDVTKIAMSSDISKCNSEISVRKESYDMNKRSESTLYKLLTEHKSFDDSNSYDLHIAMRMELDALSLAAIADMDENPNKVLSNSVEVNKDLQLPNSTKTCQRALELMSSYENFSKLSDSILGLKTFNPSPHQVENHSVIDKTANTPEDLFFTLVKDGCAMSQLQASVTPTITSDTQANTNSILVENSSELNDESFSNPTTESGKIITSENSVAALENIDIPDEAGLTSTDVVIKTDEAPKETAFEVETIAEALPDVPRTSSRETFVMNQTSLNTSQRSYTSINNLYTNQLVSNPFYSNLSENNVIPAANNLNFSSAFPQNSALAQDNVASSSSVPTSFNLDKNVPQSYQNQFASSFATHNVPSNSISNSDQQFSIPNNIQTPAHALSHPQVAPTERLTNTLSAANVPVSLKTGNNLLALIKQLYNDKGLLNQSYLNSTSTEQSHPLNFQQASQFHQASPILNQLQSGGHGSFDSTYSNRTSIEQSTYTNTASNSPNLTANYPNSTSNHPNSTSNNTNQPDASFDSYFPMQDRPQMPIHDQESNIDSVAFSNLRSNVQSLALFPTRGRRKNQRSLIKSTFQRFYDNPSNAPTSLQNRNMSFYNNACASAPRNPNATLTNSPSFPSAHMYSHQMYPPSYAPNTQRMPYYPPQ